MLTTVYKEEQKGLVREFVAFNPAHIIAVKAEVAVGPEAEEKPTDELTDKDVWMIDVVLTLTDRVVTLRLKSLDDLEKLKTPGTLAVKDFQVKVRDETEKLDKLLQIIREVL